jgi:hypothetical protein
MAKGSSPQFEVSGLQLLQCVVNASHTQRHCCCCLRHLGGLLLQLLNDKALLLTILNLQQDMPEKRSQV